MVMTWLRLVKFRLSNKLCIVRPFSDFNKPILKASRCCFHTGLIREQKSPETKLCRQLKAKIRMTGPITVADYMREVLTNSESGYYMTNDVFGAAGDFITSPEISQMFGELLGIWCVHEWMQSGSPRTMQVVELGPGRGTLIDDMLRVFCQFKVKDAISFHLVEVSPAMSDLQQKKLCNESPQTPNLSTDKWYKRCRSRLGPEISWYQHLDDVPKGFSFFVAHEFFDALPVHIFQKRDGIWHEMMIDIDENEDSEHHLRFVLSFNPTVASRVILEIVANSQHNTVEICPEAGVLMNTITERVLNDGGFALIADYGHCGEKEDTFRAFKQHKLHHPLSEPGTADLTADVDFSYLKKITKDKVTTLGPVSQRKFLQNMGIAVRLQLLLKNATPDTQKDLISGYKMLTDPEQMGERFKFMALIQHKDEYMPAGFSPI